MAKEQKNTRKLRAILNADVKDYSRLMSDYESYTIETLKESRKVMSEIITRFAGRVVDAPGDNLLAEFSSIVNAVQGAVDIQKKLERRNADIPPEKRLEFRIGVNIGDVVKDGESLYGEGVNIAARIQGLADPGGICISRGAYDHVKNKLELGYEYIGEHQVKNIKHPVRVYKILLNPEDAGKRISINPKRSIKLKILLPAIIAAILLTLFGHQLLQQISTPDFEPASIENMNAPLPGKTSVAVLPFENLTGDLNQNYLGHGIAKQVFTKIAYIPDLFAISPDGESVEKRASYSVKQAAEELGVQYIVKGSVQRSGDQLRVTAQLSDAISGYHVWGEAFDGNIRDVFKIQDLIAAKVLGGLKFDMDYGPQAAYWFQEKWTSDNPEAFLKTTQGHFLLQQATEDRCKKAIALFEEAIRIDPEYIFPYVNLGFAHLWSIRGGWAENPKVSLTTADQNAQKALALDDTNDMAHSLLSHVYLYSGKETEAVIEAEKAIDLNPNGGLANLFSSFVFAAFGRYDRAISAAQMGIRLNPKPPNSLYIVLAWANYMTENYEAALDALGKSVEPGPDIILVHACRAAVYTKLHKPLKAQTEVSKILKLDPDFCLNAFEKRLILAQVPSDRKEYIQTLEKAGLPLNPKSLLPEKPSIAVLPFTNLSRDPVQDYFSDGMTEDIITALSKTPNILVIARNSTFFYKDKKVEIEEIGKELDVGYVLEGSVQKTANKVRVNSRLIDVQTGHKIWAERYDRHLKDIFILQDEITKSIITELQVELSEGEQARIFSKGTESLDAYLKVMQAQWHSHLGTRESNSKAKRLAEEALAIDPDYAYAHRIMGLIHVMEVFLGMSKSSKISYRKAIESHKKAIALDESLAPSYAALGYIFAMMRKYDEAVELGQKAVETAPNSADVLMLNASVLTYSGMAEKALPQFRKAFRLNPKPPNSYYRSFGHALRLSGQYEEAILLQKKAIHQEPDDLLAYMILTYCASLAGRDEDARDAAKEILRIDPDFSEARLIAPFKDREQLIINCEALKKAGLDLNCDNLE